jgi:cell division protein FtsB
MSAAGSYPRENVKSRNAAPADEPRQLDRSAASDPSTDPGSTASADEAGDGTAAAGGGLADRVDLTGLSVAGITRRRMGWVAAGLLSIWIVIVFARQVGDAAAASSRAVQVAQDNAALAAEVESLQNEVDQIVRPAFVSLQARAYGLGNPHEIPFTLDPSVPAPVDGAPGSSAVRLGAEAERQTPLESWLSLLFGPGR